MSALRYLAKRRFNHIDAISISSACILLTQRHWGQAALVFLFGVIVSAVFRVLDDLNGGEA